MFNVHVSNICLGCICRFCLATVLQASSNGLLLPYAWPVDRIVNQDDPYFSSWGIGQEQLNFYSRILNLEWPDSGTKTVITDSSRWQCLEPRRGGVCVFVCFFFFPPENLRAVLLSALFKACFWTFSSSIWATQYISINIIIFNFYIILST